MNILYCISNIYKVGGKERVLTNKVNWLAEHGHTVGIVTTDQNGEPPYFSLHPKVRIFDLEINYDKDKPSNFIFKLHRFLKYRANHYKRLKSVVSEFKPEIIVSLLGREFVILPAFKDRVKWVAECHFCHFSYSTYSRGGFLGFIDKISFKSMKRRLSQYDAFVVLTDEDKIDWNLENIHVIPNARTFNSIEKSDVSSKRAITVGRYTYQKGFERLIDAWELLVENHPDWILTIVGDGEERDALAKQIEVRGLTSSIFLQPSTKNINEEYMNSSIMVMSSRFEGLPMTLLEAQAYGLPIVSFACKCGPRDVVENGVTGYLVPEGDVNGLAGALEVLMGDYELRVKMSAAAKVASERYEEGEIMNKWVNLFVRLTI